MINGNEKYTIDKIIKFIVGFSFSYFNEEKQMNNKEIKNEMILGNPNFDF